MPKQQSKPTLPYKEITQVASYRETRDIIAKHGSRGKELLYIEYSHIRIREGFNKRIRPAGISDTQWEEELKIPELAKSILQNGLLSPLEGDILPDGYFYTTDGYRRFLAIGMLLRDGFNEYPRRDGAKETLMVNMVEIKLNPFGFTEKDRALRIFTSQDNLKLKDTEVAKLLYDLKENFPKEDGTKLTNKEIADQIGKSRQYVDNMISLYHQPQELKDKVDSGEVSKTAIVEISRTVKEEKERANVVEEELAKNRTLKVKTARSKRGGDLKDDMPTIDCSEEKTQAVFKCNNSIGLADKISTRLQNSALPAQHKSDLQKFCEYIVKDLQEVREIIEKMPDRR